MIFHRSPRISLEETKGLSDVEKNALLKELNDICEQKKGEVVIYDLTQTVQAFLHTHNKEPCGSFYDQMVLDKNKRDEALLQQQAQKLSHNQQRLRDEILKRQENLQNENRWRRESRRSMSEQSPKHRTNSSAEMADNPLDQLSECGIHLGSEDLYFPNIGRKIRRGCCISKHRKYFFFFFFLSKYLTVKYDSLYGVHDFFFSKNRPLAKWQHRIFGH